MFDDLTETIKKVPRLLDSIKDLAIFKGLKAISVPEGDEIDCLANLNSMYPVCEAVLLSYQKRTNVLLGKCENIGRSLYPEMTFFTDTFEKYKRLTPSVQGKRAESLLETFSKGALYPTMQGTKLPFEPQAIEKIESDKKW